jgi:membrane associated rhomboid family serine protease
MTSNYKPFFTIAISILTMSVSLLVAFEVSGSLLGKSPIRLLANYGALTTDGIENFEVWRFVSSQFIHVHQKHMIYNVLSIVFLGTLLERKIGFIYMLCIWFFAGAIGTFVTVQFGTPPWNIGTGASQAAFGFAGFGLAICMVRFKRDYLLSSAVIFSILPAMYLDFKVSGDPKINHLLGLVVGCLIAIWYLYNSQSKNQEQCYERS